MPNNTLQPTGPLRRLAAELGRWAAGIRTHPLRRSHMIEGAHSIIYSSDPDADRAFFRDVLALPNIDVGEVG